MVCPLVGAERCDAPVCVRDPPFVLLTDGGGSVFYCCGFLVFYEGCDLSSRCGTRFAVVFPCSREVNCGFYSEVVGFFVSLSTAFDSFVGRVVGVAIPFHVFRFFLFLTVCLVKCEGTCRYFF